MTYHSKHEGTVLKDKFTTEDIFARIIAVAREEMSAGSKELFFSALAAGFAITLTFFLYATLTAKAAGNYLLAVMLYPLGFVFIVLGGYQLFTENTLPPVALVLERIGSIPSLLRVWFIVLTGNVTGGFLGALLLAKSSLFSAEAALAASKISTAAFETGFSTLFLRAMMAGLIVAGVVWLDYAMREGSTRFFIVYLSFLAIPLAGLNHVVITATEAFYLFFTQGVALQVSLPGMVFPVLLGNTIGGVLLVTVVNYFQTPTNSSKDKLSWMEWLTRFRVK